MAQNLIPQKEYSVTNYNGNIEPGSAANAIPANSDDSIYDENGRSAPPMGDNSSDESSRGVLTEGPIAETGKQNLDDNSSNQDSVNLKPSQEAPISKSRNRENNVYSDDNDSSEFLPSTVAYPESPYSPFDPLSQDINNYQYVAKGFLSSQPTGLSDNPMDPNWGGVKYTQDVIKSGKYSENNITRPLLFQPKGVFIEEIPSAFGKPQDKLV
jgi:hypothetical protein